MTTDQVNLNNCGRCGEATVNRAVVNSEEPATAHLETGALACGMGTDVDDDADGS